MCVRHNNSINNWPKGTDWSQYQSISSHLRPIFVVTNMTFITWRGILWTLWVCCEGQMPGVVDFKETSCVWKIKYLIRDVFYGRPYWQRIQNLKNLQTYHPRWTCTLHHFITDLINSKFKSRANSKISVFLISIVWSLWEAWKKVRFVKFKMNLQSLTKVFGCIFFRRCN